MSLSLHLELADLLDPHHSWMFGSGWRSTNHVVTFQNSLLAAHKGVRKGTLIDDYVRPEENDIRRRFLSDEDAAFTLLFSFENDHGLFSLLFATRLSFLPERYHHEGVLAHESLQVKT